VNCREPWLRLVAVVNLMFLYLPILVLLVFSFNASRFAATWQGFSWHWYGQLIQDGALHAAAGNSLIVAVVSTVLATALGIPAALGLERLTHRSQQALNGMFLLPLVIPEVMMGVSLLLFFVMIGMPLSLTTVILGHAAFNLPVVIVIVRAKLRKLDPQLQEAAANLGASPWQVFRLVTLPLLRPAIFGAVLMAFTVSLDDFIVTFFVAGPGATTLPLKVYSMIKSGVSPEINALSALMVLLSMGLVAFSLLLQRR
jgi:ABC-type spermidine/putrescine transport system permease subunit II